MPDETKKFLPSIHFPEAYSPDDKGQWLPLTAELLRFLFSTRKPNTARLILALLQQRPFDGSSYSVQVRHRTLSKMTGINHTNVSKCLGSPDFLEIVEVEPGIPATRGNPGEAARYGLRGVVEALVKWRAEEETKAKAASARKPKAKAASARKPKAASTVEAPF